MDNLKISNPNASQKTKGHEKYMNRSVIEKEEKESEEILDEILKRNKDL